MRPAGGLAACAVRAPHGALAAQLLAGITAAPVQLQQRRSHRHGADAHSRGTAREAGQLHTEAGRAALAGAGRAAGRRLLGAVPDLGLPGVAARGAAPPDLRSHVLSAVQLLLT